MPTFLPERASHAGWASQFDEETAHSDQKREINGPLESLLGLIAASLVLPLFALVCQELGVEGSHYHWNQNVR